MFKAIRDNLSYVVNNNLILEYLCLCGPLWKKTCLMYAMCDPIVEIWKLGFHFDEEFRLLRTSDDKRVCDKPYTAISTDPLQRRAILAHLKDAITNLVYQTLVSVYEMIPLAVPKSLELGLGTFILVTRDYEEKDVLLILIPGTEDSRAGQWSRKAILEEGFRVGSQIPHVDHAVNKGYGVMILNPADNFRGSGIPRSDTPKNHGKHVWDAYVKQTKATKILIVAHSYGGIVTSCLSNSRRRTFEERVAGVALIDSLHVYCEFNVTTFFKKVSKHWVTSDTPLNTPLPSSHFDVEKVSSGHPRPEVTPYACKKPVFEFFEEKLSTPQVITEQVRFA